MRRRILIALALLLAAALVWRRGCERAPEPPPPPGLGASAGPGRAPQAAWDSARWQPGARAANPQLLAIDGRTMVAMLDRGTHRPLILIVAAPGSQALDRCASRWRELFEVYKDRVEFLTVFAGSPPSAGPAAPGALPVPDSGARVPPATPEAVNPHLPPEVRQRIAAALTFAGCNDWRIPILVDGVDGAAERAFGAPGQQAILLDESRRMLGTPLAPEVASDLEPLAAWLRHRFTP